MILSSGDVTLRAVEPADAAVLHTLVSLPEVEAMVVGWSGPVSLASQEDWINRIRPDDFRYAIEYKGDTCGMAHLHPLDFKNRSTNINLKIVPGLHGKGIGRTTVRLLLDYLFRELDMHVVTASILESNLSSLRLFERSGFQRDGLLRERVNKRGRRLSVVQCSILRREYDALS